jgi:hypothetical protein
MDNQAVAMSSPLTMTELITELRSFTQKFNAALFQAGFNCLELHRMQNTWRQCIVWVVLDRLPNANTLARPWSRWSIMHVLPVPKEFVATQMGGNQYEFLQTQQQLEREQLDRGYLGVITIAICGRCDRLSKVMHNVTCIGFGPYSQAALKIEDNWEDTFKDTVERMCGRDPSQRVANLPESEREDGSAI